MPREGKGRSRAAAAAGENLSCAPSAEGEERGKITKRTINVIKEWNFVSHAVETCQRLERRMPINGEALCVRIV